MEHQKAKEGTQWVLTFHRQAEQEDYRTDRGGPFREVGGKIKKCRILEGRGEWVRIFTIFHYLWARSHSY